MNKNTKEQFKQAQNGNKKVREQLVIDNLGLVKWQAGKFVKYKNDVDRICCSFRTDSLWRFEI